jgi:hypothetical protein
MAYREVAIPPAKAFVRAAAKFVPPSTMDEADTRKLELVEKLDSVNAQLSARNGARDDSGEYLEDAQSFFTWRTRAIAAKRHVESELRHLNLWIKQQRRSAPIHNVAETVNPNDPVDLLRALHRLVHRLACEGVDLDPAEQALKDVVQEYLNRPQGIAA